MQSRRRFFLLCLVSASIMSRLTAYAGDPAPVDHPGDLSGEGAIQDAPPAISVERGIPGRVSRSLYESSDACAKAKLDIWIDKGRYTVSSLHADPEKQQYRMITDNDGSILLLGGKGCEISIRIERGDKLRDPTTRQ